MLPKKQYGRGWEILILILENFFLFLNLLNAWSKRESFWRGNLFTRRATPLICPRATPRFLMSSHLTKILLRANLTEAVYGLDRVKRTLNKKCLFSRQTVIPVTDIAWAGGRGWDGRFVFSKRTASICRRTWNGYRSKRCRTSTEHEEDYLDRDA